jgi:hypothetical protein
MSTTFVFEDNYDGLIRHIVNPSEADATLCEELIDARDGFHADADPEAIDIMDCGRCWSINRSRVLDQARSDVAQELGVDESEVF